jgi:hypothetical protein
MKAWAAGQPEPDDWQLSIQDNEPALQDSGGTALRVYLGQNSTAAPVTFQFDQVRLVGSP